MYLCTLHECNVADMTNNHVLPFDSVSQYCIDIYFLQSERNALVSDQDLAKH